MKLKSTGRRLATGAAALAIAGTTMLTGAGPANADSVTTINGWSTWSNPVRCKDSNGAYVTLCIYYSPGAEGAMTMEYTVQDGEIDGTFWKQDQYGSAGYGQKVRNNAASVENASNSTIGVWVYPWFYGDANYVPAGRGGSLTSNLRNNEASWGMVDQLDRGGHVRLD
ncbi:hypothetical protein OG535_12360 [Kitasatospora sp. NBC_00085]|uniref:hypothetical protein n=1 Tax=unclassified Kitasatospora TaxID=2633591 RepID=UPI0032565D80